MGRLVKYLFYLLILAAVGLISYAYLGPWFGADFSPPLAEVRLPVTLNAD
ncbi:MAG: hypothetical protein QNK42_16875 [Pseudodonghicola sp.]|nr:hypothetical protein [Pseudodonghicola sp.]